MSLQQSYISLLSRSSPAPGVRTTSIGSSIVNVSLLDETFRESSQRDEQVKALKKENHELKLQVSLWSHYILHIFWLCTS